MKRIDLGTGQDPEPGDESEVPAAAPERSVPSMFDCDDHLDWGSAA